MRLHTPAQLAKLIEYASDGEICKEKMKQLMKKSWKYSSGKYAMDNKNRTSIEAAVPVWYVQRQDMHGSYLLVICIDEKQLTEDEKEIYQKACVFWEELFERRAA